MSLGTLGFCTICLESWYLWLGTKIMFMLFLWMFFHLPFHPELSSTNVTSITSVMCLFMCKRHFKHCYVKCVENDSRKKRKLQKKMPKKHKHVLVPSQRYQDFRHLLQNLTIPNYVMGFSNHAQRFTGSNYLDVDSPLVNRLKSFTIYIIKNHRGGGWWLGKAKNESFFIFSYAHLFTFSCEYSFTFQFCALMPKILKYQKKILPKTQVLTKHNWPNNANVTKTQTSPKGKCHHPP